MSRPYQDKKAVGGQEFVPEKSMGLELNNIKSEDLVQIQSQSIVAVAKLNVEDSVCLLMCQLAMLLEIEIQTQSKSMFFLIWLILYFSFFIIYISFTINFNGSICSWTSVLQDMHTLLSCFTYINSAFICQKT